MLAKLATFISAIVISRPPAMAQEKDSFYYVLEGVVHYEKGEYFQAIEDYDKAIALDPEYAGTYYNKGNAKYKLGQYFEAIEDYDKAIALDPEEATAFNNRGIAKRKLGRTQAAKADFQKACQLNSRLCDR